MNPLKLSMIEDYVHNDKPIAGTVAKEWLRLLLADNTTLRSALAYYSAPSTYMVLNGIPVLQDKGERARIVTGISSTSEKLPGNPEEDDMSENELEQLREELEQKKEALAVARGVMNNMASELAAKNKVLEFARAVLCVAFDGGSLDGGDIQDLGEKHGLLIEESYDPEKHGESLSLEWDFEPGDTIYTFSDILKAVTK